MSITLLLLLSAFAGLVLLIQSKERGLATIAFLASTGVLGLSLWVSVPVLFGASLGKSGGIFYLDAFGALLLLLVGAIQWTAMLVSRPYLHEELHEGTIALRDMRLYYVLFFFFICTMFLTLVANNIGLMWVALEGTTLATTILVAFYTKEGSLEAAWKYILLCSVGISLGLLGVLFVFYAAIQGGSLEGIYALSWSSLRLSAATLPPAVMRLAFVFIFIGYGTKVGLMPMHTWLPDAHGRTPSPISGLLSGVLLNIALFAIVRYKSIVDVSLGDTAWTNTFFLVFGALSFALPAAFILVQRNYKRLLAYSSIEHMGFSVLLFGLGVPGMVAGFIHLIGHSITKSFLFFGTGNILLRWKSTKFENVSSVMTVLPYTGSLFVLGLLALLAVPPSPLFLSEYMGFMRLFTLHPLLAGVLLLSGAVIFAGFIRNMMPMLYAKPSESTAHLLKHGPERWNTSHTAMLLHLVALGVLGVVFLRPEAYAFLEKMAASLS